MRSNLHIDTFASTLADKQARQGGLPTRTTVVLYEKRIGLQFEPRLDYGRRGRRRSGGGGWGTDSR